MNTRMDKDGKYSEMLFRNTIKNINKSIIWSIDQSIISKF